MSIWNVSLDAANLIYALSWIGLLVGAALTLLATAAVFWSSGVRDKYADERTVSLEFSTAEAKLEQAKIQESNLRLQIDLERERAARIEIETGLASRRVSPQQCAGTRERLAQVRLLPQTLVITQLEEESNIYAAQITDCLKGAGVPANIQRNGIMIGIRPGLQIHIPKTPQAEAVKQALSEAGIEANYITINGESMVITVGPKPQKF